MQGALEAARSAEMQAVEERRRLKEKERALDSERWKLQEMEEDLVARAQHLDRLMQVSFLQTQAYFHNNFVYVGCEITPQREIYLFPGTSYLTDQSH